MSRTYRRKADDAPEWVTTDWDSLDWANWLGWANRPQLTGKKRKKEVSKWHSDSGWHDDSYANCPGWWIHEFMEKPFRTKTKRALKKVMTLIDYEEADVPTVFKKPHIYYW